MKSRTLLAMGVAGAFACSTGGAFAGGGMHHSAEVQTPASVSESAPWLTGESLASSSSMERAHFSSSESPGASGYTGASGSAGYDSTASRGGRLSDVDYWLLGADTYATGSSGSMAAAGSVPFDSLRSGGGSYDSSGMTSSLGASGSTGFDSALSSADAARNYAVTEVYLVPAPLAAFDGDNYWTMEVTPTEESIDRLASVTDFYIVTPIYEAMVDTSLLDSAPNGQLSLDMSNELSQDLPT